MFGLVYFDDHRCGSFAELRSVIIKARALALSEERESRRGSRVLAFGSVDEERGARMAATTAPH
jgi:hypothetical protein